MLNSIIIAGRTTRTPDKRVTGSGTSVINYTIAVDRDFKDKTSGERVTDFIDCVAYGSTADFIEKYVQKGTMLMVNGRLQIRDWTDKDNNKRRNAEVVTDSVYFGESRKDGVQNDDSENRSKSVASATAKVQPAAMSADEDEDSLPF